MKKEFVSVVTRCLLALGFFCAVSAQAADAQTTINVPADQPTIQAGIDAAVNGDTVMVAPGTYFENLNFNGKAVTVTSSGGAATTIVDGGGLGPVVIFDTNEGANSVLNGFTLQNGRPSQVFGGFGTSGGGILVVLASPTITNNVINGNHAICGIGMEIRNGSPLIRGNTITNNTQAGGSGGCGGGGIEITGDSSHPVAAPLITGNTITNNSLNGGGFGGGINVSAGSPTIRDNQIAGNSVWNSGGGINLESSGAPVVVDNIISNNTTLGGGSGAGIYVQGPSSSADVVINNTIVGNNASDGSSGIYSDVLAPVIIGNNIVVAASGQNGIVCDPFSSIFPAFSHNDVTLTGTSGAAWSSNCASFASTRGNISAGPQFVNAASNDFHLLAGSPVIDAGDNTVPDLPQLDFDGNPRVAIGNATTGSATVDMGVYEFVLAGTPAAVLSPTSISFADQPVNTSSAARTVTLFNTGANPLTISAISVSGDFSQSNTCPTTLTSGGSCAIQVTFQPTVLGTRTGTLTVSSNSVPAATTVTLSGNGVQAGTPVTINVPDNEPSIQAGIDAAANGDTVVVAPGAYFENLNFNGKAITVTSSGGPSVTTVDGGGLGPVVIFDTNEGANSVLNGFTLQNGVPSRALNPTSGGGILVYFSSPTITNNIIAGNHAICGIGMEIQNGSPLIRGNTITNNTQAGGSGGCGGGGIEVTADSSHSATPLIASNIIINNSLLGANGGGIAVDFFAAPTIQNNYIAGNAAGGSGGGVFLEGGTSVLVQNIIVNNSVGSGGSGGGISISSPAVVANNTIAGNTATNGSSGIFTERFSPTISNNIVVAAPGQTAIVCSPFSSIFPIFSHNDVISSGGQAFSSNCASFATSNGNTSFDPLFENVASGDYHLLPASPAVDAGDNGAPNLPPQDYDNNPRIEDGNGDGIAAVDLGAFEVQTNPQASVGPPALSFGIQVVSSTTSAQTVTVSNPGSAALALAGISISGDFSQTNNCPSTLNAASSCAILVTFTPTATGTRSGTLSIATSIAELPPVALIGTGVQPAITVNPATLNFGDQQINTTAPRLGVTVTNPGSAPLHLSSFSASGDPDLAIVSGNCPLAIAPGGSCTLQFDFTPHSVGPASATVSIGSDAPTSPTPVALSGNGINPIASLSPASLTFADQLVNTASTAQIVSLSNTGIGSLQIFSISATGDFMQSNTCPATLNPGSSCAIQVTFQPTATGVRSGSLTVSSSSAPAAPAVLLTGNGVQPAISVSPAAFSFADQPINTTGPDQFITVNNPGTATLHISSTLVSGSPYLSVIGGNCGTGVPPAGSCSIELEFTPLSTGLATATLSIGSDAPTSPTTVALSGNGIDPIGTLSPSGLNFGNQQIDTSSAAQTVTLSNTGTDPLTISGIFVTGDFTQSNTCPASLAVGGSCTIQVTFHPTATGTRSGFLTISSNSSPPVVADLVTGTGVNPAISVSPGSIAFGNQTVNTPAPAQTITVSNPGTTTLHVNSLLVTGDPDFFTVGSDCVAGTGVLPGGTCTIQMEFQPQTAGAGSATLTIGSDAANGPVPISLSGTGVNPVIATVSPTVLNFGNQAVGSQSPTQIISLTNTGTGVITVSGVAITGDPDFILVDNGCAGGFAAGITCPIRIAFAPKSLGTGSATLTITSNASNNPVSVALSGTGVTPPQASVSPASIDFGNVSIGAHNATPVVTVSNTGGAVLHINSLSITGDTDFLTVTNNCVGGTGVAPGGSCTIQMEFQPQTAGPASATLNITSDAPTSPTTVALSGKGIDPIGTLSPSSLNFGNQPVNTSSAPQTITLSNTGTDPLTISGISVSGDFTQSNTCPATLAAGSSCTIQVTFHPTATGTRSGFLSVASNSSPPVVSGFVTGTGVNPAISVNPGSIAFGDQAVNTDAPAQTITVTNPGTTTLHINSQPVSGDPDFFVLTSNCVSGAGVAPGGTCSIQVEFAPKSVGPGSAMLSIGSDAPTSPTNIALSGNGTGPDYSVSAPASLSVRAGDRAQTTITVSAVGGSYSNSVALSCSNLPTGASCSFSPSSVVPGATSATSRLTINTQQSGGIKTAPGTYSITVLGTSAGVVRSTPVTLTVTK